MAAKKTVDQTVDGSVWVDKAGEAFLGRGRIELLRHIAAQGSISAAARAMGMSYKTAWQAVDTMNNLADQPLVERSVGGRHGGGTRLTPEGLRTVEMFRVVEEEYRRFLGRLNQGMADLEQFTQLLRRFAMKTSARNQFLGEVVRVDKGAINAEVELDIGHDQRVVSVITNESVDDLGLAPGREAHALIKASAPILVREGEAMRTSARNRLCGTVDICIEGAVNAEVGLALAGGRRLTAIVTNESIRSLGLKEGVSACALIKASNVILAVND